MVILCRLASLQAQCRVVTHRRHCRCRSREETDEEAIYVVVGVQRFLMPDEQLGAAGTLIVGPCREADRCRIPYPRGGLFGAVGGDSCCWILIQERRTPSTKIDVEVISILLID